MNNVIQISDLRAVKEKAKKISVLKENINEYIQIKNLKQNYLNNLRKFDKYATIETECQKVYTQILDYDKKIRNLKDQIDNLSQG